jgi:hypothetical protein
MTQITIQQALDDIEVQIRKGGRAEDIPLRQLLRPWLILTDLEWQEGMDLSAGKIWRDLQAVHQGLASYLKVMGSTPNPVELQEAACRLIGEFQIRGADVTDGDINLTSHSTISFEGGAWVYVTDARLRLRDSKPTFREALREVRQMLDPSDD